MIVQETHYDPWGMELVGIGKKGANDSKFKYNGKESQAEFDLNWIDYGWRNYDAQLGRWHCVDNKSEKYLDFSVYHFVANNPIMLYDYDGNEFTPEAQKHIKKLRDKMNEMTTANNSLITKNQQILNDGYTVDKRGNKHELTGRQINDLNTQISNAQSQNVELAIMEVEINALEISNQMYDISDSGKHDVKDDFGRGSNRSGVSFNRRTGVFEINISKGGNYYVSLAHELKHAYQFEIGDFSSGPDLSSIQQLKGYPALFYDAYDELDAYNREKIFGGKGKTLDEIHQHKDYNFLPLERLGKSTNSYILKTALFTGKDTEKTNLARMGTAYATKTAFRLDGVTYYTKQK
jgi:RHS repeat-associated protein